MKHNLKIIFLIVVAVSFLAVVYAQDRSQYTKEQIQEQISQEKQLIRELAKMFLVDALPELVKEDPTLAEQALVKYKDVFSSMDQNEFIYLLGHFYVRVGENAKAISHFTSLLNTHLNEDARKMLNLVLFQQMVHYLEQGNRKTAKDFLSAIVFENYNIDRYYPTYLYIWADMAADDGEYESVINTLNSYIENRDIIMNRLLPEKMAILARVQNLNLEPYYANPSPAEYKRLASQIDGIKADLTRNYNELISLKGIFYLDSIVNLHSEEMAMLDSLKMVILDYIDQKVQAEETMARGNLLFQQVKQLSSNYQKQLEIMDKILEKQYERFLTNDPSVQGQNFSDMELKRLFDIEKNIQLYNNLIAELDKDIADPDLANIQEQLKRTRADYSEKRTSLLIRKNDLLQTRKHISDVEEQIFNALLQEYYSLSQDKKDIDVQLAEIEQFMQEESKNIFTEEQRNKIKNRIATQIAVTADSGVRNEPIRKNAQDLVANVEFVKLQLDYRNLHIKEQARIAQIENWTEQQLTERQAEILAEKRDLITRIQNFINNNPNFKAVEQPNGTFLISNADLYYNLAELQYAVYLETPTIALESYRKVVQLDPNNVNIDAALYNIGFISSQLSHQRIGDNKARFYEINRTAVALDDASRYKESDFAEAISSYQRIIDNYKTSPYYDESLYRLGILYYYIATDADQPQRYYALATNCFDEIINKPDSKYKYDAIYQRGWLRLNSFQEQDFMLALNDFLTLLNAVDSGKISDPMIAKGYREDAIDNIAFCLIALDGSDFYSPAKGVAELQNIAASYKNPEIISSIIDKAAANKLNLSTIQAIDFIWLKIDINPLALENPTLVDSILQLYASAQYELREGQNFDQIAQDLYQNIITNYGKNTAWYQANMNNSNISAQLAVIKNAYEKRAIRLQNEFLADPANETKLLAYYQHIDQYAAFPELQGENYVAWKAQADKTKLLLGNTLTERSNLPKHYLTAIRNLQEFNAKYPQDEDFFLNEGLIYTYSFNIYNLMKDLYGEGFQPEPGLPANADELFALLQSNSQRFISVLRSDAYKNPEREIQAVNILLSLADIQYDRGKLPDAKELYLSALENETLIPDRTKFTVYGKLASIAENEQNYAQAETYYRKALPYAATPDEREAIINNICYQIQNSFEAAESAGNYSLAASERLRLAEELGSKDAQRVTGYKMGAQEAYIKAKEYQKAIDILLELAGTRTDIGEIYYYYFRAAEIAEADTAMNNPQLAKSIRESFIAKYPSSNQAFKLRMAMIQEMEKNPAQKNAAADAYLALYEEARNKTINTGNITPDALLAKAAILYSEAENKDKAVETYNRFITLYPNSENVIPFMQESADYYLAKGDTLKFEQLAKEIYQKDKTKGDRYQWIATLKLSKLVYNFDNAYKNKNYTDAFKFRDEYKRLEAVYKKEGLNFETKDFSSTKNYEYFAAVEKEYNDLQKRIAFLKNFDNQLTAIEKGTLMTSSPAALIKVNASTTWQNHLIGGSYRRIPNFKASVKAEVAKVNKLLADADKQNIELENYRRLRALNLIARIYEKGVNVINTQIGVYVRTASEVEGVRQEYKDVLDAFIATLAADYSNDLFSLAYTTHLNIYNFYQLAGYTDYYTQQSYAKLQEWNLLPDYKMEEYPLGSGWTEKMDGTNVNLPVQNITSPKGVRLSCVQIPSNKELILNRTVNAKIQPEFALLHLVYPYDIKIRLNGTDLKPGVVPTDTLDVNKPITTTRLAYLLPSSAWVEGQNIIELTVPNDSPEQQSLYMNLQVFIDRNKLAASIPPETVMLYTDPTWRIITVNPETGVETASAATITGNFGITLDNIVGLEETFAKPIWFPETAPVSSAIFEVDFYLDTEFRDGLINFVAPEVASVYLNGQELAANLHLDYDPEPFRVYTSQVTIDPAKVTAGKNTLRFVVTNNSNYRGFIATVKIIKAGKGDIR